MSHLYTECGDYKGFHLRIEARTAIGEAEPSFFVPASDQNVRKKARGFRAGFMRRSTAPAISGEIPAGFTPAESGVEWIVSDNGTPVQPGEWFVLEILASDVMQNVFVNGVISGYFRAGNDENPTGHIALEQLTPNTSIEFRSIQIREFDVRKPGAHQIAALTGHGRRVACAVLSPDSQRVITGGNGLMREGWGAASGTGRDRATTR